MSSEPGAPVPASTGRRLAGRALGWLVSAAAVVYFFIDAVSLLVIRPLLEWLGRKPLVVKAERWVRSLGPYPTLALLLVPLVALEPLKPLGLYVMATGRPVEGALVLGGAELLKLATVERLFRMNRDKLLTIPWFARGYGLVTRWLARIRALPAWQAVVRAYAHVKDAARRVLAHLRQVR